QGQMTAEALKQKQVTARVEHRAYAREGRSNFCVVGDIDHVACQRDTQSNAEAGTMHGGEGGRGKIGDSLNYRIENALENRFGVFLAGLGAGEIAASGKC